MRLAIISDIHGNLEALQQSFKIISESNIDETICLGDIVGYGANPNECLDLVREKTKHILLGNHDEAAIDLSMTEYFNPYARAAAEWTSEELTEEHREFIRRLPHSATLDGLLFVHSAPYETEQWHYIITPADAQISFEHFSEPVCFVGHSHVPGIFCEDGLTRELIRGKKFIINVGSIGQPRDSDPRLSFGIIDSESWQYENIRAAYDIETAAKKIRKAGLPGILAERLLLGK